MLLEGVLGGITPWWCCYKVDGPVGLIRLMGVLGGGVVVRVWVDGCGLLWVGANGEVCCFELSDPGCMVELVGFVRRGCWGGVGLWVVGDRVKCWGIVVVGILLCGWVWWRVWCYFVGG